MAKTNAVCDIRWEGVNDTTLFNIRVGVGATHIAEILASYVEVATERLHGDRGYEQEGEFDVLKFGRIFGWTVPVTARRCEETVRVDETDGGEHSGCDGDNGRGKSIISVVWAC